VTYESTLGGFRHLPDVPVSRITKVALVNYVMQEIALFSYVTGKASVGCLILRFLGPKTFWRRWIIWGVMILTLISNSINCILTLVQCDPPKALWDHSVKGKCWNPQIQEDFALFVAGIKPITQGPSPLADAFLSRKYNSRCRACPAPCYNLLES